ncbi:MAG: bifunctional adenosylcobinamide kinase/adenosylcobinamide-phosphate guanylyltransferase [Candidatus Omnitrophica bacterium]|nr:bifunctional adenosylcobinamide kinase/adenosylcobinamide-phosphate guanylyltransferase [Candidatus Omnitrophota bacterium]
MKKKIIFIIGGARSGKSSFAVALANKISKNVSFIATCNPQDREMKERVLNHKKIRPAKWKTIEEYYNLSLALEKITSAKSVIIDCLTLWVSNLMMKKYKEKNIMEEANKIMESAKKINSSVIIVSTEVGSGIVPTNKIAREFRDIMGRVHQTIAKKSDEVYLMTAGIPVKIKNK